MPSTDRIPANMVRAAREVFSALKSARCVLITSEPYPDGDAVGAEIALYHIAQHAFRQAEREGQADAARARVYLVNEKGCPRKYRFLAGSERIRPLASVMERNFDLGIVVDGGRERIGDVQELFDQAPVSIYIDHHKFGSRSSYNTEMSDPTASSTTQLLWPFFADPTIAVPLNDEVAQAIYLGLIFDTGSFQYSLTQPLTHEIAAELMDLGLDFTRIHEHALLTSEFEEIKVHGPVLAQAQRNRSGQIIWSSLSSDLIDRYKISTVDCNRVIQNLTFVEGTEVSVLFREEADHTFKLSLRSRGRVDVGEIARDLDPSGGGHDRAAGCTLYGSLEAVTTKAVGYLEERLTRSSAKAAVS